MTPFFQKTRDLRPALVIAWAPVWLRGELEHGSEERSAAAASGAVEITRRVPDQARVGKAPVRRPVKGPQHGFLAVCIYFEHCTEVKRSAPQGSAVEIARRVPD